MNNDKEGHLWLLSYGVVVFAFALSSVLYLLYALIYGSFFPHEWAKKDGVFFISFVMFIFAVCVFAYFSFNEKFDVELRASKLINIDEYKGKNLLEIFLAHYSNFATVGLVLCLMIFTVRPLFKYLNFYCFSASVGVLLLIVFTIYMLFFLKSIKGLIVHNFSGVALAAFMFVIDQQGFAFFIKSIPPS